MLGASRARRRATADEARARHCHPSTTPPRATRRPDVETSAADERRLPSPSTLNPKHLVEVAGLMPPDDLGGAHRLELLPQAEPRAACAVVDAVRAAARWLAAHKVIEAACSSARRRDPRFAVGQFSLART
jgi:hypothetical protein